MKPVPPFASLRMFEAVVRHGGFRRAAEQLGVTQSAVSQHVRKLEIWTGSTLLIRGARNSKPTADGRLLADAIASGFETIGGACETLRQKCKRPNRSLMISTLPGFALKWLFPRLIRFDQSHPDIPVSIATETTPIDFADEHETLVIRYGLGLYPGLHVDRLFGETLFPVCAPSLLERGPPLDRIEDLGRHTLLVDEVTKINGKGPSWRAWFQAVGFKEGIGARTRRFGQANMVVQAAIEGLGVALGREPLVIDELIAGRLVRPFEAIAPSDFAYFLVCPKERLEDPQVQAFRDWLLAEAKRMASLDSSISGTKRA
ncbi:MAG: LysR substrate-binding domain-containing protein [Alphaproteobacteria bacterium]|nr:LysR substrate-binding domain-containing protein [Alphaproteobacteria bacterium]